MVCGPAPFSGDRLGLGLLPPHLSWTRKPGSLSLYVFSRLVLLTASSRKPLWALAFSLPLEPMPHTPGSSVASCGYENSPHFASQTH